MTSEQPLARTCLVCGKRLPHVAWEAAQPVNGTVFTTEGHYGSGVFDPMNGDQLSVAVCDGCLVERQDRVLFTPVGGRPGPCPPLVSG